MHFCRDTHTHTQNDVKIVTRYDSMNIECSVNARVCARLYTLRREFHVARVAFVEYVQSHTLRMKKEKKRGREKEFILETPWILETADRPSATYEY